LTSIIVVAGAGSYNTLLLLLVPIVLVMYSAVILSVIVLRKKQPDVKRYYTAPFGNIGPIVMVLILIALIITWLVHEPGSLRSLLLGVSFIATGIPVYFLLELYYNPRAIRKTNNLLAYLVLWAERLALPISIRKEVMKLLGKLKGKKVLEFGCSVGTLTMHLAQAVGKNGKVYATDISERDIQIAKKRLDKKGHKHVKVIHDLQHHNRVHPDVPNLHKAVSVGTLGYVKDIKNVLMHVNQRLKIGGEICFLDYDKFFDIIPNKEWLGNDKRIKKIFENGGFKVEVKRKQGFAWKYIFIFGEKVRNVK
jgi:ubiquinone/menaquinone biosynthesis C-methylase UbiE